MKNVNFFIKNSFSHYIKSCRETLKNCILLEIETDI